MVVVRYPHVHFDRSRGHISLGTLMLRMFTQFHNFMEIKYLPVVSPSEHHKESAIGFAEKRLILDRYTCFLSCMQEFRTFLYDFFFYCLKENPLLFVY
ncbi:lysophospholipid acyltransferase LPEAT2-like [Helianthus annuus]|uniref:lysophospholipid acyltransferase LPEAT2-like n=1 Tax=Helianthus annuus TaxID=4232 RepID=UPI00165316F4|nr:lysophospholipid acyltransferase LPEAT2-like [Helianthus annuus]